MSPRGVRRRHRAAQLPRARISIEQVGLGLVVQQRMVLVLSMDGDEVAAELAQLRRVGGAAVDAGRAPLAQLPLEDERGTP